LRKALNNLFSFFNINHRPSFNSYVVHIDYLPIIVLFWISLIFEHTLEGATIIVKYGSFPEVTQKPLKI